jgi:hypothetical protein
VFENRVLGRIFGQKRDEMLGGWRKLNNEELHNLYSSPNIVRMTKSMGLKLAGYLARMGENWKAYGALVGKAEVKRLLEGPTVSGCIILKWILKKYNGSVLTAFIWLRTANGGGLLRTR